MERLCVDITIINCKINIKIDFTICLRFQLVVFVCKLSSFPPEAPSLVYFLYGQKEMSNKLLSIFREKSDE
jgi:hypothetical protein